MKTRILLFTGKGGVGKTSVAAATAALLAEKGLRTLIMSTDPAHSLSDAVEENVGPRPRKISENLFAQEVSVLEAISQHWEELKGYLTGLFRSQGLDPVSAEEIATLPGFDEASHLLYLNEYIESGDYDVIILDSAPTGEALKLLSFPEAMSWYMEKFFPLSRTTAKLVRPVMKPLLKLPIPDDSVFESLEMLYKNLGKVRNLLSDNERTSIRLVCNPDRMSLNETKRAYTYLMLYEYPVDAVIINKIYRDETGDFFQKWRKSQEEMIHEMEDSFADVKIFKSYMTDEEPMGIEKLKEFGNRIYCDDDPFKVYYRGRPIEYIRENNESLIRIKLPFADKKRLNLFNKGGELIIEMDNWRRVFYLPQSFSDKTPESAEFINQHLLIRMV